MHERFLEFTDLLRRNGVRVSPGESLDAFAALEVLGLGDRSRVRSALRSTLVKRELDLETFDELFDLFFRGLAPDLEAAADGAREATGLDGEALDEFLKALLESLEEDRELSDLAREWLGNDGDSVAARIREALEALGLDTSPRVPRLSSLTQQIGEGIGLGRATSEIENLIEGADDDRLRAYLEERMRDLAALVKQSARKELEKRDPQVRNPSAGNLGEKSFYYLSDEEIRKMREAVNRLARRLRNAIAIRRKRGRRGKLDVKDTLRHNLETGGTPFRLRFRRRRRDKPQVLVLCDVSDSVRNASRFMLQFVYSLQDLYSRVRSYVFVAEPGEVTRLFDELEIQDAIEAALSGEVINVFAHSDFGRSFQLFHDQHLGAVTNKTTVIILGDARNNYNPSHDWALAGIAARAKRLVWLNPESRMTWGFGDSEMDRYSRHCDLVEECRNLNQLYRVVDRLIVR